MEKEESRHEGKDPFSFWCWQLLGGFPLGFKDGSWTACGFSSFGDKNCHWIGVRAADTPSLFPGEGCAPRFHPVSSTHRMWRSNLLPPSQSWPFLGWIHVCQLLAGSSLSKKPSQGMEEHSQRMEEHIQGIKEPAHGMDEPA